MKSLKDIIIKQCLGHWTKETIEKLPDGLRQYTMTELLYSVIDNGVQQCPENLKLYLRAFDTCLWKVFVTMEYIELHGIDYKPVLSKFIAKNSKTGIFHEYFIKQCFQLAIILECSPAFDVLITEFGFLFSLSDYDSISFINKYNRMNYTLKYLLDYGEYIQKDNIPFRLKKLHVMYIASGIIGLDKDYQDPDLDLFARFVKFFGFKVNEFIYYDSWIQLRGTGRLLDHDFTEEEEDLICADDHRDWVLSQDLRLPVRDFNVICDVINKYRHEWTTAEAAEIDSWITFQTTR